LEAHVNENLRNLLATLTDVDKDFNGLNGCGYNDETPAFNSLAQSEELGQQLKTNLVSAVPMGRMGSPD
jgi:hypothetical protein